jgi:hypothetical protein
MAKVIECLLAILFAILIGSGTGAASPQKSKNRRNASGTWSLDLTKSDFGDAPKPKSAFLTIATKGKSLSWTSDVVRADGNHVKTFFEGAVDGKEYPVRSEPDAGTIGAVYALSKDGTTHATIKSSIGRLELNISLSRDAMSLVIKNELIDNEGERVTWSELWRRTPPQKSP